MNVQNTELQKQLTDAQARINSLEGIIQLFITSGSSSSLLTQTSKGWEFTVDSINSDIDAVDKKVDTETTNRTNADSGLDSRSNELERKTAYIDVKTDSSGHPYIELGESSSNFKIRITNTDINFMDGNNKIAYINGDTFYGNNITAVNRLQVGNSPSFYWQIRANGNLGLNYKA